MAARLDSVGKFICERGSWRVSNLQLQKIMYMSQMVYMGRNNGDRLVDCDFEAWDYGPVSPDLYRSAKMFGSAPVRDIFFAARHFGGSDRRKDVLLEVCDELLKMRPGDLVNITHWPGGAWAKHYVPGARGIPIPDSAIFAEYRARVGSS